MQLLPLIVIFALGYLLLVRPQQQRARRQRELISSLEVGAEVQTAGGILGRIVSLDDQVVRLEVAPGVVISFVRGAIARVVEVTEEPEADGADPAQPEVGPPDPEGPRAGDPADPDHRPEAEAG